IAGITCVNDVTARDLQRSEEQWTRAKGFDTFCPVGPRLVPVDPRRLATLEVFCRVNGKERQHGHARDMVFTILTLVSFASQVTIVYNRPSARGRTLFGKDGVVVWGRVWCPGADAASTIAVSTDVTIGGQPLAAGKYSIWAIPGPDEWTLIFSRAADVFHVPYPGESKDALRLKVKPQAGPFMESLAYYFPAVDGDRA